MSHSPGPWKVSRGGRLVTQDNHGLLDDDMKIAAAAPELLELLLDIEWSGDARDGYKICPECAAGPKTHLVNCKLHILLERLK
jgi:hypothetical protein